jgi:hypothetical protein
MKSRQPAVVVLECLLLLVVAVAANDWIARTFVYRYTPSLEHESVFLRNYSPRPVLESFAVQHSIEIADGIGSGSGRKFVTNERTIDPTFAIQADLRPSLMTALSEDLAAQLVRNGATIVAKRGGPQGEFRLSYRDGTSAGSVLSYPFTDWLNQSGPVTAGTQKVCAHIVISEKWFPREIDAIRASTQSQ